jgi:hypothetical protein
MSELIQIVEQQGRRIDQLIDMVGQLTTLVMKDKVDNTWVSEEVAAEMLGYKDPRTLRKLVKGVIKTKDFNIGDITFRNTNGRNWQYSRKSILKYKEKTSFN